MSNQWPFEQIKMHDKSLYLQRIIMWDEMIASVVVVVVVYS